MAAPDNPGVKVTVVGLTDVGRVREHNEDAFLVVPKAGGAPTDNREVVAAALDTATVFAVCDGMGGAAAGEVASRMAAEKLASALGGADYEGATPDQIASMMDRAVQDANDEILTEARENVERKGMGTTLTAAIAIPGRIFISQVGDSRGYLLRKGKLFQLTKDQSLIAQLIEEGTLTEEEAEKLGGRNIVLQAVGVEDSLRVDTKHWEVLRGDVILLCSDGLNGMIDDAAMEGILNACGDDIQTAADQLIDAANEGGGRDNITVVLARFEGDDLRPPMDSLSPGAEQAGAGFAAPPPPDVPNPMKKVGAALAAIIAIIGVLFFALQRTTADLAVSWMPSDLAVTLTIEGGDGFEPREIEGAGGMLSFVELEPGEYEIAAVADGYFETRSKLTIESAGDTTADLRLVPKPGAVEVRVSTPHVRIILEAKGDGSPGVEPVIRDPEWPDPSTPLRFESGIPAGPVTVRVTREGFDSYVSEVRILEPEGELIFEVGPLTARMATLRVSAPSDGFAIRVLSEKGEELATGTTDATGSAELIVRQGRHEVRVTREGFDDFVQSVEIGPDGASVVVEAAVREVSISVTGKPSTRFSIETGTGDKWETVGHTRRIGSSGRYSRGIDLAPGHYRITWDDGAGSREFDVVAGEADKTIGLE